MNEDKRQKFLRNLKEDVTNYEKCLHGALDAFGWRTANKQSHIANTRRCPFDSSHLVKQDKFASHLVECKLRSLRYNVTSNKALIQSTRSFYKDVSCVAEVTLDSVSYARLGLDLKRNPASGPSKHDSMDRSPLEDMQENLMVVETELDNAFRTLEDCEDNSEQPPDEPIERVRWIYSWKTVPMSHTDMQWSKVKPNEIKAYLIENLPHTHLTSMTGGDIKLMQFVYDCLHGNQVGPDRMMAHLKEIMREKTRPFVLNLWKFLSSKIATSEHNITKEELNDAKRYGLCLMKQNAACKLKKDRTNEDQRDDNTLFHLETVTSSSSADDIPIPMAYVDAQLTPSQRLMVYEHVIKVAKSSKARQLVTYEDLEKDTETQLQLLAIEEEQKNNAPRSHLEVMAELRDYKRRRQTYRAKNTHITRRSATGILKDVIDEQMKYLEIIHKKYNKDEEQHPNADPIITPADQSTTIPTIPIMDERSPIQTDERESRRRRSRVSDDEIRPSKRRRHSSRDKDKHRSGSDKDRRHKSKKKEKRRHRRSRSRDRST